MNEWHYISRDNFHDIQLDISPNQPRKHLPVGDCFTFDVGMSDFTTDMCWWFDMREDRFIQEMTTRFNAQIHQCDNGNKRMYFLEIKDIETAINWLKNEWMPMVFKTRETLNNGKKLLPDNDVIRQRTK